MYRTISLATASLATATMLFLSGCGGGPTSDTTQSVDNTETQPLENSTTSTSPTSGESFVLDNENTKVGFIGTHVGEKPDPRKGGFKEVSGSIEIDSGRISSIAIEIDTSSLYSEIDKLTNHLKSPDFFDVRQFPMASFKSTSITAGSEDQATIKGELTLLGVTKEISFPAKVVAAEGGVSLTASFEIDRTEFGMDFGPEKVEKIVQMTVVVGGN